MKKTAIKTVIIVAVIVIIAVPLFINYLAPKVSSEITADGLLSYIISAGTATGTILLAYIAVWQNKKFQKENTVIQERLEKLTREANEISSKMLEMEESKKRPFVNLIQVREIDSNEFLNSKQFELSLRDGSNVYDAHESDFLDDDNDDALYLFLKNMSLVEIVSIIATDVAFIIKDVDDQSALREYRIMDVYNSQNFDGIDKQEKIAFKLPFPDRIWIENVSIRKSENQKTNVNVQIEFLITNQYGREYKEIISFDTINVISPGMLSLNVSNKRFSIENH